MAPTAQKTDLFPAPPASPRPAGQFCGFYGAKVDTNAFNNASQVVLERTDDKTITTKDFYWDMFDHQVKKAAMRAVFTEYAWDMNWSDPCDADPLSHEELLSLGVFRLTETPPDLAPGRWPRPIMPPMGGGGDVFVTRLRMRDAVKHFPERLMLQETSDLTGWQVTDINPKMSLRTADARNNGKWWQNLWTS